MPRPLVAAALVLWLPALASAAAADEPPSPQASSPATPATPAVSGTNATPVFYETTTVSARPVSSATGAVTVLDSREIEASASRSTTDLAEEVPGLNVLSSGSRAGGSN